jgi:glycosyltransferase involved in cell wall biosynthesis
MLQFVPAMQSAGIDVSIHPLISDAMLAHKYKHGRYRSMSLVVAYWRRILDLLLVSSGEIAWIEKEAFPWCPAWLFHFLVRGQLYVLEFDDAIFHTYDQHRLAIVRKLFGKTIDSQMRTATLVIAGNHYIASRAQSSGAPWIEIVPTVVDAERYQAKAHYKTPDPLRVVWIGSPSTAQYLATIAGPLEQLKDRISFIFRVIGAEPPQIPGVLVEKVVWSEESEASAIGTCDIGIMPLPDTPWERGKCAYKLVQYMACGLPTIASPVGANNDVVENGVTGFFAANTSEWVSAIEKLMLDPGLRERMGLAGREKVINMLSLRAQANRLIDMFNQVGAQ